MECVVCLIRQIKLGAQDEEIEAGNVIHGHTGPELSLEDHIPPHSPGSHI